MKRTKSSRAKMLTIQGGTFAYKTIVCVNCTSDEINRYIKKVTGRALNADTKREMLEESETLGTTIYFDDAFVYLIVIPEFTWRTSRIATLVHEIFHTVSHAFHAFHVEYHPGESNEVWAYEIDRLTQAILDRLKEIR